ncbi:MAG: helix-turn-helix domain-containing protein [Acidiferrobacteraceae bacterium]
MNEKQFRASMGSVREAGKILRGTARVARAFRFPERDVQAIRAQTDLPQAQFAALLGVSAHCGEMRTAPTEIDQNSGHLAADVIANIRRRL